MKTKCNHRRFVAGKTALGRKKRVTAPAAPQVRWSELDSVAEHCANEPGGFFACGEGNAFWLLGAKLVASLLLFVSLSASAAVREVGAIGLTVGNLNQERGFFTKVLPFEEMAVTEAQGKSQDELLSLSSVRTRTAELRLGGEHITLTEHLAKKGNVIPTDSRSFDHWFQHIAIVVSDMDKAYTHLRAH